MRTIKERSRFAFLQTGLSALCSRRFSRLSAFGRWCGADRFAFGPWRQRYCSWRRHSVPPRSLHSLNVLWSRLGLLLGRIVSPVVLGAMFFLLFTPGAILFRLFGKDLLRVKRTRQESYWLRRTPPGPAPETVVNQF